MRSVYRPEKMTPLKAQLSNIGRRKMDLNSIEV